jgi:hypothetical protein
MVHYFNMSSDGSLCYLVAGVVSVGLIIWGFMQIFGKQLASENDNQVIQRQLKGFALLLVAQIVLVLGSALCAGMGFTLKGLSKSLM